MIHRKKPILLLMFNLVWILLIMSSASSKADIQDYDKIGVKEGNQYTWTLSDVDSEVYKDLYGEYRSIIRDGKQIKYNIENIRKFNEGLDEDNWSIEYEQWDFNDEEDDDGYDYHMFIYKDYSEYMNNLEWFTDDKCEPTNIEDELFFIPLDAADFLTEVYADWSGDGAIEQSQKKLTWTQEDIKATLEYDGDGILNKIKVEYKKDTVYVLELTNSGLIPLTSSEILMLILWITIPTAAVVITVIIILLKRRTNRRVNIMSKKKESAKKEER